MTGRTVYTVQKLEVFETHLALEVKHGIGQPTRSRGKVGAGGPILLDNSHGIDEGSGACCARAGEVKAARA